MDYPFQVGIDDNQTQAEKDHITELVTGEYAPISEHTYKGGGGKERICDRVFLPKGFKVPPRAKLPATQYYDDKTGTYYFTPDATHHGVLAKIIYTENGEYGDCDSKEWLKFCKGGEVRHTPLSGASPTSDKAGMMAMAGKDTSGESDISKGIEWEKVEQRKMSKGKSSKKSS
jgi:hypothetical protein